MTQSTSRVARYREKAEEARVIAEGMGNSNARETVLEVAATWDRLADEEEKNRAKVSPPSRYVLGPGAS
jgi:hypothetical protein